MSDIWLRNMKITPWVSPNGVVYVRLDCSRCDRSLCQYTETTMDELQEEYRAHLPHDGSPIGRHRASQSPPEGSDDVAA